MTFNEAIKAMKEGKKVHRNAEAWSKSIYVELAKNISFIDNDGNEKAISGLVNKDCIYDELFIMYFAEGYFIVSTTSFRSEDMEAEDWQIFDKKEEE